MNKNKIFSAIKRGFEINGINTLSMAAGSPSVNKALQDHLLTNAWRHIFHVVRRFFMVCHGW